MIHRSFLLSDELTRAGGGGYAARLFLFFSFTCSADHERDWPPCKVFFFGLATNTLNVRNNNNNNIVLHVGAELENLSANQNHKSRAVCRGNQPF